eukprot:TRINITY_DN17340_c0_g1_i1.p1 TRINITY_DN17340_c0_g1~~TRINITY_DN17340_c0_g1_i1.p1  ORF type:complete len:288 (+),score=34.30 TRINITY_DN17340_c0_g1_i1:66-929(+)
MNNIAFAVILFSAILNVVCSEDLEDLIKRRKELEKKLRDIRSKDNTAPGAKGTWPITKSNKVDVVNPRVYVLDDFLTSEECDYIVEVGKPLIKSSTVTKQSFKSSSFDHDIRKSGTANDENRKLEKKDPIFSKVLSRIHEHLFIPMEFGEPVQIGHYKKGGYYEFHKDSDTKLGRTATFLVYLNDVDAGGETIFPGVSRDTSPLPPLNWDSSDQPPMSQYCDSSSVFRVAPKKGRAVLFFSHNPDITEDKYSLHGSCPVKSGEKWILQRWIRFYTDKGGNKFFKTFM